jgi:hypothetical protein
MVTHNEKNKKKNGSCEKEKKESQPKMFWYHLLETIHQRVSILLDKNITIYRVTNCQHCLAKK